MNKKIEEILDNNLDLFINVWKLDLEKDNKLEATIDPMCYDKIVKELTNLLESEKKEFWTDICLYIAKNKLMKPKDYLKFTKFIYENL